MWHNSLDLTWRWKNENSKFFIFHTNQQRLRFITFFHVLKKYNRYMEMKISIYIKRQFE